MSLPDYVLNEITCCLNDDQHILLEPVLLKCGGNACKECINDPNRSSVKCLKCHSIHLRNDFTDCKVAESLIRYVLKDLSKNLDNEIQSMKDLLKEENILDEMQLKIESLENQMDLRVESLISQINKFRAEYMDTLKKYKMEFEKFIKETQKLEYEKNEESLKNGDSFEFFQQKQRELKFYKKELLGYRTYVNKFKFTPSEFSFEKEKLGFFEYPTSWLKNSVILNGEEAWSLAEITQSSKGTLLYRATRDGFTAKAFHSKCDGKAKTITIIKTNANYVFGGYASAAWNKKGEYIADRNAFIFSLRRNGASKCEKLMIKRPNTALIGHYHYGPIFGGGSGHAVIKKCYFCDSRVNCTHGSNQSFIHRQHLESGCDIFISDNSNIESFCETNVGQSYECPEGYVYGQQETRSYLAGIRKKWITTEIEVYQISD